MLTRSEWLFGGLKYAAFLAGQRPKKTIAKIAILFPGTDFTFL